MEKPPRKDPQKNTHRKDPFKNHRKYTWKIHRKRLPE
jgi:hypothetical protein